MALLVDCAADDVRCYPLAARGQWRSLGPPLLGDDVALVGPELFGDAQSAQWRVGAHA